MKALPILILLLLTGSVDQRIINLDVTPPILSIGTYSAIRIENYSQSSISLSGTASDDLQIANVVWYTTRGMSGTCTGVESWRVDNIPLSPGENLITIAASDLAGNVGVDCITVVYGSSVLVTMDCPKVIQRNQAFTITVSYENTSKTTLTNFILSVNLPQELTWISGGNWDATSHIITWKLESVAPGVRGSETVEAILK